MFLAHLKRIQVSHSDELFNLPTETSTRSSNAPGNFVENGYPELFWEILLGIEYGNPPLAKFWPYALPDEEPKKLKTPTLLLLGDHEILYEVDQAIKRAEGLVENIQTAIIPNASHMVNWEQTRLAKSHILDFLSGDK